MASHHVVMRSSVLLMAFALLASSACGPKTMQQRMNTSERIGSEVDDLLARAERELQALEPEKAQDALADARSRLAEPDAQLFPEYEMLNDRLKADEAKVSEARALREKRRIEKLVAERKAAVAARVQAYRQAFDRLVAKDVTAEDLATFDAAAKELSAALAEDELVKQSEAWAAEVRDQKELIERGEMRTNTARARVAFSTGPGAASVDAKRLLGEASASKLPDEKLGKQRDAVARLNACAQGQQLIEKHQVLTVNAVWVGGAEVSAEKVVKACEKDLVAAKKTLDVLEADAAKRAKLEAEKKAKEEAERARQEKLAAEKKAKEDAAREKAEAAKKAAEEKKAKAEAEKKAKEDAAREKAEAAKKAVEEKKAKAEAAKKALEEKKAKAEADKKAKEDAAREKAEAAKKAAEEKKAKAHADKKANEDAAREKAEAAKKALEEKKAKALADKKAKEDAAREKAEAAKKGQPAPDPKVSAGDK
jgi:hypothetical protein